MNFANLTGLSDSYGNVTQIADAAGNVLWKLETNKPVILEVEKITSDTYAGETAYTGEQFILLDIYPKTNGTVNITYGGLTKTITDTSGAAEPNAQKVFFGTFNGVSDSVTTPGSGTLTIEGDYCAFGAGTYQTQKAGYAYCGAAIKQVIDWGENISTIPSRAFQNSTITNITIPATITKMGDSCFTNCNSLAVVTLLPTIPPTLSGILGFPWESFTEKYVALEMIVVPKGCGNAYKTATQWSSHASVIVEAS